MDLDRKREANRLYANKQYKEARAAFQRLIRDYPREKDGYVGLAKVLEVIGDPGEIVAALEPAAKHITSFSFLAALAGAFRALYFRGQTQNAQNAIAYGERTLAERFDPVTAHYLADVYATQSNHQRAAELYEECSRKGDSAARAKAIECFELLGQFEKVAQIRSESA